MTDPQVAVALVADDKTAKGIASAEKRIGKLGKHSSELGAREMARTDKLVSRSGGSMIKTFGQVEQASARALGGKSISSGVLSRLGAVGQIGSAAATGMGEAAAAGGMLSSTLGIVGVAAAGTIGVLAAAAYGAFKFADGWARGAAQVGRTADLIGVSTKALMEFNAAAERVGVDKGTSTGALGGLSQSLNDARYGRNQEVLAVLGRLGVKMQLNPDGTVDVAAMLPAIADAIARQNSSGKKTAGRILGIPDAALPAFTGGGKQLSADMADADKRAPMLSEQDVALGKKVQRRDTIGQQMIDRQMNNAGRATAEGVKVAGDAMIGSARSFERSSGKQERAAEKIDRAADKMIAVAGARSAGRYSAGQIASMAVRARPLVDEALKYGARSEAEARAIAANAYMESGGRADAREKGGSAHGRGLFQITDRPRKALFRQVMGVDVEHATREQQWKYYFWERDHSEAGQFAKARGVGEGAGPLAAGISHYVERSATSKGSIDQDRDAQERAALADAIPVHVTVEMKGAPPGTKTSVKAGKGPKPAVSHAFEQGHIPVHGG